MISIAQLGECGVSATRAKRWRAHGLLHRIHRGVYAFGHASVPTEGLLVAALFHAGPGAALSHATGAWWWGLIPHQPLRIEVSSLIRVKSLPDVHVHRPRQLVRVRHRRLPVTAIPQTLLDFASQATDDMLGVAFAEADYRRVLDLEEVRASLGRGRAGSRSLRRAIAAHEPRYAYAKSRLERAFLALCKRHRIPLPRVNVKVAGWLVDAVWPEQKVVVELDGYGNHRTRAQLNRDHQRDLELRAAGFTIARYTETQVEEQPKQVAADLNALLRKA